MSALQLFVDDGHGNFRPTDPETSAAAAVIAIRSAATNRRAALEHLHAAGDRGLTDFELADLTGVQQTSIGKRRGELRDAGLVARARDTDGFGITRPSPTNSPAAVWILTDRGVIEATERSSR
jgi:DNA-binding transcriptional ArsR family regulator